MIQNDDIRLRRILWLYRACSLLLAVLSVLFFAAFLQFDNDTGALAELMIFLDERLPDTCGSYMLAALLAVIFGGASVILFRNDLLGCPRCGYGRSSLLQRNREIFPLGGVCPKCGFHIFGPLRVKK